MTKKRTFDGLAAQRCRDPSGSKKKSRPNYSGASLRASSSTVVGNSSRVQPHPTNAAPSAVVEIQGAIRVTTPRHVIGQAAYQKKRAQQVALTQYVDFGDMSHVCPHCNAYFWAEESIRVPKNAPLLYTSCCLQGRVKLPRTIPTPSFLDNLLNPANGQRSLTFRKNIRAYNNIFAFTSFGADVDKTINQGQGPFVFKISGQVCHLMGSLIPPVGECPKFAQLYIYDVDNEIQNRHRIADGLDIDIIAGLVNMFNECNGLVQFYRTLRNRYSDDDLRAFNLTIIDSERDRTRQYNAPQCGEIAGLIVGDIGVNHSDRDVIVHTRENTLKRVSRIHEKYMSFQYPIIFPHGESGYNIFLKLAPTRGTKTFKRTKMSMSQYIEYYIHERVSESPTMFKCGRLFQQYLVDAYATVEEDRLFFIRKDNTKYRVASYEGINESFLSGNNDGNEIGQRIILPSSHTGSPRYMIQHYQDAMTICRHYGPPDLFITFTCNPKWPEITRALADKYNNKPEDRPDIVSRVFKMKHDDLVTYIKSRKPFGEIIADVSTIEFQKRGLPHSHMLFWMAGHYKCYTSDDIDSIISAEIPDKDENQALYDIVSQSMIHGPCGVLGTNAPCMKGNKCSKFFPKQFSECTTIGPIQFPIYKRRDIADKFVEKNDIKIDNGFVVPYNAELLLRYNAHINVELCSQSMLIKYLFKYINKGPDRARVGIQSNSTDEITNYLNCRYISACESAWRLFDFPIHSRHPAVELLTIHLPNQQSVVYNESQPLNSLISNEEEKDTKLTAWFKINSNPELRKESHKLTYGEIPLKFVWKKSPNRWEIRRQGFVLGRLAEVRPTSGELYYLRLLLNVRKGCTSFQSIRTRFGVIYSTFKDACRAYGLLGDDKEWSEALAIAVPTASSFQLRHLFVTLILYCDVSNPSKLLDQYWSHMCDDIKSNTRNQIGIKHLNISDSDLYNLLLFELEQLLNNAGTSLKELDLPMPNGERLSELQNIQLIEELQYDCLSLANEHSVLITKLNSEQRDIYEKVVHTVSNKEVGYYFVYGHGGTGKTYLWRTIISKLRSEGKIVLAVASSGIASLLLPNGRTAHSRFKIPLDITDSSTCKISKGTHLAKLVEKTELIIWDEAPMTNKFCFESLDKSLQDILQRYSSSGTILPFGGIPILLGGDFRQILPVIRGGTKAQIVDATLNKSELWKLFEVFYLKTNMRLLQNDISMQAKQEIAQFADWLLQIGDGDICDVNFNTDLDTSWVHIPAEMLIPWSNDPVASIFHATFPNFLQNFRNPEYIKERAIITPTNMVVHTINNFVANIIPGEATIYRSHDTICPTNDNAEALNRLYPPEVLNVLNFSGLPTHELILKIGMPIMLMRNLNQSFGLCNGTRLIITNLFDKIVEARVLTGSNTNEKFYLPRVILSGKDEKWPFKMLRRQFPIRPCYAMTINKSQGQSLKQVGLYLPQPVFGHGQLYVALSRVTSKQGIKIVINNESGLPNDLTMNIVYKDILQQFRY